jgi:hypothetical protein
VVVVDEASMVDIVTMYRLVGLLGTDVRIVMAGDPEQLMPVGPGLVLHALIRVPAVPLAELKIIKRYGVDIAVAAVSIRKGIWPQLSNDETGAIAFIPCGDGRTAQGTSLISETVLDLFGLDPANTQILSARKNGGDGVKTINSLCQANITTGNKPMMVWSVQHDQMVLTPFHLGDPVLCTRNMWDRGLQNGSLGTIVEIEDVPWLRPDEDVVEAEPVLAWVLWDDGVRRPVVESMLDDLELGYAITVHKAQGSQWPRVIVTLTAHRLLDRTLIYTAITRAQRQVLIVGDPAAAKAAVEAEPRVRARQVALDIFLKETSSFGHGQAPALLDVRKAWQQNKFQEATIIGSTPQRRVSSHKVAAAEAEALVPELLTKMGDRFAKADSTLLSGKVAEQVPLPSPAPIMAPVSKATVTPKPKPAALAVEPAKEGVMVTRDTFSMPAGDYALIEQLRVRAAREGRNTNKSEVVRAGLQSLIALEPAQVVKILNGLEKVKPGRK